MFKALLFLFSMKSCTPSKGIESLKKSYYMKRMLCAFNIGDFELTNDIRDNANLQTTSKFDKRKMLIFCNTLPFKIPKTKIRLAFIKVFMLICMRCSLLISGKFICLQYFRESILLFCPFDSQIPPSLIRIPSSNYNKQHSYER